MKIETAMERTRPNARDLLFSLSTLWMPELMLLPILESA
jgi:hypothetical protein